MTGVQTCALPIFFGLSFGAGVVAAVLLCAGFGFMAWLCNRQIGGQTGDVLGALEQIGDRVSSIVWLDAFKPENGQRGFDFASEFSRKALLAAAWSSSKRSTACSGVKSLATAIDQYCARLLFNDTPAWAALRAG